jgi:hypothetical protein
MIGGLVLSPKGMRIAVSGDILALEDPKSAWKKHFYDVKVNTNTYPDDHIADSIHLSVVRRSSSCRIRPRLPNRPRSNAKQESHHCPSAQYRIFILVARSQRVRPVLCFCHCRAH